MIVVSIILNSNEFGMPRLKKIEITANNSQKKSNNVTFIFHFYSKR